MLHAFSSFVMLTGIYMVPFGVFVWLLRLHGAAAVLMFGGTLASWGWLMLTTFGGPLIFTGTILCSLAVAVVLTGLLLRSDADVPEPHTATPD